MRGSRGLVVLYDTALPHVYGYLRPRCGARSLAEDLTAETFLAAVDAQRRPEPPIVDTPWLMGVARHKLVDHWRRVAREELGLHAVGESPVAEDPWDGQLDAALTGERAHDWPAPSRLRSWGLVSTERISSLEGA